MNIYIAASLDPEKRKYPMELTQSLRDNNFNVYGPWEHTIEHAWDWPNEEWGLMVFEDDINAIKKADWVVVLSWGRKGTTQGTAWEQGFAFGIGKQILFVEMNEEIQSLMAANGRYASIKWDIEGIINYLTAIRNGKDFDDKLRTKTEQK